MHKTQCTKDKKNNSIGLVFSLVAIGWAEELNNALKSTGERRSGIDEERDPVVLY